MELSEGLLAIAVLITMWQYERFCNRIKRTLVNVIEGALLVADAYEGMDSRLTNLIRSVGSTLGELQSLDRRISFLDRSLIERPQDWIDALAGAERTRYARPVESLDEEASRVQEHDPRNELSAVRAEIDAELGIKPNEDFAYQIKPVTVRDYDDGAPAPAEQLRTAVDYGSVLEAGRPVIASSGPDRRQPGDRLMFDTHVVIRQKPNDAADAARLYGEIRERAEAEVRSATIVHLGVTNLIKIAKISVDGNFETCRRKVRALFAINGHEFDITVDDDEALSCFVSKQLAVEVLGKMAGAIMNSPSGRSHL